MSTIELEVTQKQDDPIDGGGDDVSKNQLLGPISDADFGSQIDLDGKLSSLTYHLEHGDNRVGCADETKNVE